MPIELAEPSPNALAGSWQLAHETDWSDESRLSKKRSLPSSVFSAVYGLSSGQKIGGSPSGALGGSGSAAKSRAHENKAPGTSRAHRQTASGNLRFMTTTRKEIGIP